MKAIITAGGRGTRMQPLTFSTNKHFIPLANKPLLFYAIEAIADSGIKKIAVNYNPGQLEEIKSYLGTGRKWGVKFCYILQEKPRGLANIIYCCRQFLGKSKFVMHLGDNIFHGGIKPLVDEFKKSKASGMLTMIHHPESFRMGVPYFDKKGRVKKLIEKPKNPPHNWAIPGLYFADSQILECFSGKKAIKPSPRGEYEITAPFQWLINQGYQVRVKEFTGTWRDPGKFDDWIETNRFLLDTDLENGYGSKLNASVKIEGRVAIGKKCRLSNSVLRGPVLIGDQVTIKDSFIGPYSSIGDGCQVAESKVENSVLMPQVKVDSLKEPLDSSLIGQGTIIEGNHKPFDTSEMFVGNQCHIKL
jgi:glucose-1-phosphate thymidylyltransferase